ncbi:hypothetical protein BOTBODRAFT_170600 [Botryobasidium botryosum FD-172 SS1]|uniref:Uncharacterized protein n=1 Tax=Botryobasidium botryosum (strain FD-172 SS1) TaxID=930990 RepID=A0A067MUT0_BOTB1|nr:hypothetical protein BOTBODRAFT_170600 [Botryobasidium botryosum FD-172 SS1]
MAADSDIQSPIERDAVPTTRSNDIQESAPQDIAPGAISDAPKVNSPTAGRYITVTFVDSPSPTPTPSGPEARTPLTHFGRQQAEALGKEWASVRIDQIHSSPLERAHDTAKALAAHNIHHPKIVLDELLVEQDHGPSVARYLRVGIFDAAARERWGPRSGDRSYRPPGGESLNHVANRGLLSLSKYILKRSVQLTEEPDLSTLPTDCQVGDLPEGIPHHVIVSHNIFLCELHDLFVSWNLPQHRTSTGSFENTGWTRYLLCYDEKADCGADASSYASQSIRGSMQIRVMKPLGDYSFY